MKILVTGYRGQLGFDVVNELIKRGHDVTGVNSNEMDITDSTEVEHVIKDNHPDAVIHCAAYTAVDKAEDETEQCKKVNVNGTANIASICRKIGCKMMYISTDYVFDGTGERPWEPDDAIVKPLNHYGLSKYEGELEVLKYIEKYFIVRISWVFGVNGNNFVKTMLRLGKEKGAVKVIDDQIGSPTYTADLAVLLADMIETDKYGKYHASNEGFCSWYEFACEIFKAAGMEVSVTPIKSAEFSSKAKRPENSRLNKDKLAMNGFNRLPNWQDAAKRFVDIITRN